MPREDLFIELIREHQALIFKVSAMYADQKQDQKDLYQEIVYQLWKSFDTFAEKSKISTWMYRVALNTAIKQLNSKKRQPRTSSIEAIDFPGMDTTDGILEERMKRLHKEIEKLNILEKGIILLALEGKKYEDIAEITGLSVTNVGTRMSRIKTKLKSKLTKS
ncbi:MAG: sigma-70 family RNA polymerase sigma factor [Flavobacteriaceae bacterium]|nr:sigma-70 family RNA polymerase sigma factor [Muriicola sp.]NNC62241.1 sigma-70 family RNA polymerase sigma factor [Eudoraea sp.]NNK20168.1 sigma-70 family RNA polymerase sigma factor [Flavobacteriaceae bacterium]MBT8289852.1 sigma-70 family RNA polymerase sigma factor [Muriicola sp.]NNK35044.1 sigma-70 family RNA polymerase sigma factor [Eudoraea sp.]